jgi:hypothetical protein
MTAKCQLVKYLPCILRGQMVHWQVAQYLAILDKLTPEFEIVKVYYIEFETGSVKPAEFNAQTILTSDITDSCPR